MWLHIPLIPILRRMRQEDHKFMSSLGHKRKFQVSLCYMVRRWRKKGRENLKIILSGLETWLSG